MCQTNTDRSLKKKRLSVLNAFFIIHSFNLLTKYAPSSIFNHPKFV